jgi:penicillin-binding protein 2
MFLQFMRLPGGRAEKGSAPIERIYVVLEGEITVTRALARSNNVWFYQVGIRTRAQEFLSVASRLGFGKKTGLPLFNENPGIVPTDDLMRDDLGRPITSGDTANFAIGQGRLQSTPLQVAQAMAGIANGRVLPQVRLIRQVQDEKGGVLSAPGPETRTELNLDPMAVAVVHQGMKDVVHASYGTGKRGSLSFTTVAGKTGTAQWMPNRELAWFAGFFPFENPRFAFVALYEGKLGETVSGGRLAAPMIRDFFEPLKNEIKPMIKPPARATIIVEGGEGAVNPGSGDEEGEWVNKPEGGVLRAVPVEPFDLEGENAPPVAVIIEEPDLEEEEPEDDVPPAAVIIEEPEDIEEP